MTPWTIVTRLLCPWDSPGKNIGVGCHFLLQRSSRPRDQTHIFCISCIARWIVFHCDTWEDWNKISCSCIYLHQKNLTSMGNSGEFSRPNRSTLSEGVGELSRSNIFPRSQLHNCWKEGGKENPSLLTWVWGSSFYSSYVRQALLL